MFGLSVIHEVNIISNFQVIKKSYLMIIYEYAVTVMNQVCISFFARNLFLTQIATF